MLLQVEHAEGRRRRQREAAVREEEKQAMQQQVAATKEHLLKLNIEHMALKRRHSVMQAGVQVQWDVKCMYR